MKLTFEEAVRFLFPRTGNSGTKWSLGPTRALLERLGNPHLHYPAIHVGGTNGKGSVCTLLAEAMKESGLRVGLYTSPHLVSVRERMLVDGVPITEDAFAVWTAELHGAIEETGASFFESTTAIALADFAARGADMAIVEVGLGGRLDSTNVIDPLVSAVTSVTLEHIEYLGSSLEGIAREKAGIAKRGRPFVIGESDRDLADVLEHHARRSGSSVVRVPPNEEYDGPLGLKGRHQRRNAAVAAAALRSLPVEWKLSGEAIARGFASARLPGRFDCRGRWIFDVAHNPAGVATLVAALRDTGIRHPVNALVGVLGDKDWFEMLTHLSSEIDGLWVTVPPSAPHDRTWLLVEVQGAFPDAVIEPDFDAALAGVQRGAETTVVTGSFYTVGDAMARLPGFRPLG